jgi:hypothetical protein
MKWIYTPDKGLTIGTSEVLWGESRDSVRTKLLNSHEDADRVIDLGGAMEGDTSLDLHVRQDIYENYSGSENHFSLNYNEEHRLYEAELHTGIDLSVADTELKFGDHVSSIINRLKSIGLETREYSGGEFVVPALKLSISSSEAMGGDGNGLAYIYLAQDINHLLEDE